MSLSNGEAGRGRVLMGIGSAGPQETTVAEMEARRSPMHFEEMEARFWERVRAKAGEKAKDILSKAMAEAEEIKARAHEEGYREGVARQAEEYAAHVDELSQAVSETMAAVREERKSLWRGYREDFVSLLRLAVEKTIGSELSERRLDVASNLLDEALDLIDSRSTLTVTVHPDMEELLGQLLEQARTSGMGLDRVRLRSNPAVQPGGVVLESADGMVDNSIESRWAEVETIFSRLSVDEDDEAPPAEPADNGAPQQTAGEEGSSDTAQAEAAPAEAAPANAAPANAAPDNPPQQNE